MAGTSTEPNSGLASAILAKHWHISNRSLRTNRGVSRVTWRIGREYWLSQSDECRSPLIDVKFFIAVSILEDGEIAFVRGARGPLRLRLRLRSGLRMCAMGRHPADKIAFSSYDQGGKPVCKMCGAGLTSPGTQASSRP